MTFFLVKFFLILKRLGALTYQSLRKYIFCDHFVVVVVVKILFLKLIQIRKS